MAKTLIGNIKGRDGRGIANIQKTGTTGSVDTYTIRYTDNTTSTYTVKNSDNIALQRQIVPSAAVESSATASQAYAAGDYVVVNGLLRKVKAAIAKGNAISDSNSTATTVTGELSTLRDSASRTIYGSKIISTKSDNQTPIVFTADEYMQLVGHKYSSTTDHVSFANGDWSAQGTRVASSIFGGGNIYAGLVNSPSNGRMRIDYAITTMA